MVRRIQATFNDGVHVTLSAAKEALRKELGLKRLSWEKFIIYCSFIATGGV